MKNPKLNHRLKQSGQGLVILIILFFILVGGYVWLRQSKATMDRECRAFGRQMIEHLAVQHDIAFFRDNLSPQAKLDNPRSQQEIVINRFTELGVPQQPIKIDENIMFENTYFKPSGYFTAHLMYPTQEITAQIAVSHPAGKWQLDNLTVVNGSTPPQ